MKNMETEGGTKHEKEKREGDKISPKVPIIKRTGKNFVE
jgi:hypothetical protein